MNGEIITPEVAKKIIDENKNLIILDVREIDEFNDGHVPNAIQLSYTEISEKALSMLKDKNQLILVYCRSGKRATVATKNLIELGYTNIKNFGGILSWPYEIVK